MTIFGILAVRPSAGLLLAAVLTVCGMADTAAAQTGENPSKPPAPANQESNKDSAGTIQAEVPEGQAPSSAAPAAGLRVVKDPETGKLRGPDRAEAAKMNSPQTGGEAAAPRLVDLPNGNKLVLLDGQFMSETVARRTPHGSLTLECHPGALVGHSHSPNEPDATAKPAVVNQPVGEAGKADKGGQRNAK